MKTWVNGPGQVGDLAQRRFTVKTPEIVIASAARTAIGKYGGGLKDKSPSELGSVVMKEAVSRAGIQPGDVEHVVFGNVIHTDPKDMYLSRVAAVNAGIPVETPALTLNRLCGSGLQAIVSAAQMIMADDIHIAVAGGAECMSRAQYWLPAMRWGQRLNDASVLDAMVASLTDPFDNVHMGVTAENVAEKYGITRQAQDEFAVESHRRAIAAIKNCRFVEQIVPVELKTREGVVQIHHGRTPPRRCHAGRHGEAETCFQQDGHGDAGNASGINDAAAAVVVMDARVAEDRGMKADGAAGGLRHRGRRSEVHGHGSGSGHSQSPGQDRVDPR